MPFQLWLAACARYEVDRLLKVKFSQFIKCMKEFCTLLINININITTGTKDARSIYE